MKKLQIITSLLLVLLLAGLSYGETFRQGDQRITFHPTTIVAKTAAYTLTSSDSEVDVTCSSANITITLPTVLSTRPGTITYKIKKVDATAYKVIVTPASGDTIGGESTRYITYQNAYVVVSTGSGKDWTVNYESPYTVEDYEAGTITFTSLALGGGTVITKIVAYATSLTPAATAAAIQTVEQTFTVTGLTTADKVFVNGPVPTSLCPPTTFRVSAADTLSIGFTTLTAAACTPAAGTYNIVAIRN